MQKNTLRTLLVVLILSSNFLLRLPFLHVPLERDEGEYSYIADVIRDGGLPYRDAFDQKPPATFYLYRAVFSVFGDDTPTLRLFVAFYNLISIFFVYLIGKRLKDKDFGLTAALIFSIVSSERRVLGFTANTEIFMLAPSVAAMYFVLLYSEKRSLSRVSLAGFLFGISTLFKQPAALNFAAAFLFLLFLKLRGRERLVPAVRDLAVFVVSYLAPLFGTAGYFALAGAFNDFAYQVVGHNLDYIQRDAPGGHVFATLMTTKKFLLQSQLVFWVLLPLGLAGIFRERNRAIKLLPVWLAFAILEVSLGRRFTLHYFQQMAPPFALIASFGFYFAVALLCEHQGKRARAWSAATSVLLLLVALPLYANARYFLYTPDQLSKIMYTDSPFNEAVTAGAFLKERSLPDEKVFVVGSEPEILFYAGRKSASKYIFFYPLTARYPDTLRRQKEVFDEVRENIPGYIVYVNYPVSLSESPVAEHYLFDRIRELLEQKYDLAALVRPSRPDHVYEGNDLQTALQEDPAIFSSPNIFIYKRKAG